MSPIDLLASSNDFTVACLLSQATPRPVQVTYFEGAVEADARGAASGGGGGGSGNSKLPMFDSVVDRSIMGVSSTEASVKSFLSKFSSMSYTRPEEIVGVPTMLYINKVFFNLASLSGIER